MKRRLIAVYACRANGTRLYGKPLQRLDNEITILEQLVAITRNFPIVEDIVLAISEEPENLLFIEQAKKMNCKYLLGDASDVLWRLILGGRMSGATDVFRVTTECPFIHYEYIEKAWQEHVEQDADLTVLDHVPEGTAFEIFKLEALERSHREGLDRDRSEFCHDYIRLNQNLFNLNIMSPPPENRRTDIRLTVDYPEDLILCRAVYNEFKNQAPMIAVDDIVKFLDDNPKVKELVKPYVDSVPVFDGVTQRNEA